MTHPRRIAVLATAALATAATLAVGAAPGAALAAHHPTTRPAATADEGTAGRGGVRAVCPPAGPGRFRCFAVLRTG